MYLSAAVSVFLKKCLGPSLRLLCSIPFFPQGDSSHAEWASVIQNSLASLPSPRLDARFSNESLPSRRPILKHSASALPPLPSPSGIDQWNGDLAMAGKVDEKNRSTVCFPPTFLTIIKIRVLIKHRVLLRQCHTRVPIGRMRHCEV